MGKKYIIEIPDDSIGDFIGSTHFLMPYMMAGHMGSHDTGLPIEPYTEPDLEQVRKEAYDKGYEDGFVAGHLKAEKSGQSFYEGGYKRGLSDAWEAARKIALMDTETSENVTGYFGLFRIMDNLTASEAIAKIKEYEDGKQEIKVGDEVENTQTGVKFIVTHQWENNRGEQGVSGLNYECSAFSTALDLVRKTGRHFPEIAAVLEKMRGEKE